MQYGWLADGKGGGAMDESYEYGDQMGVMETRPLLALASQSVIRPIREKNKADIEIAVSVTKKCVLHVFEPDKSDVNWPRLYQSS